MLEVAPFAGAVFLVWMDVAVRVLVAPEELPIGVTSATVGVVAFVAFVAAVAAVGAVVTWSAGREWTFRTAG
ncbi:hypothetical protein GCM10022222_70380 [Amycolatopsis ultiminotia]|uniref:Uncharacterized protein n=1 Tax=Amycolatopsis ultiminotia TaxID=543629 RepID=A0ABP6Y161_9PSEU